MLQRIAITGGDGLLARIAASRLANEYEVRCPDSSFDLCDPQAVTSLLEGVDTLLHLAPLYLPTDDTQALDVATRGSYVLANAAIAQGVRRVVLGSTLALFDQMPRTWRINEQWRARPSTAIAQLAPWLAERCLCECLRATPVQGLCLRFGTLVDDASAAAQPYDPRWLHLDDALEGIRRALAFAPAADERQQGWWLFHLTAAGPRAHVRVGEAANQPFGYQPRHGFQQYWPATPLERPRVGSNWRSALETVARPAKRPVQRVLIVGAGGPVGAAVAEELAPHYQLRLADRLPAEQLLAAQPQSPGAPLPKLLEAPHEQLVLDVRDPQAVLAACAGMDAVINLSVVRPDPIEAFRVNTLGAYNLLQAAVAHSIPRMVQTGPYQFAWEDPTSYRWDDDVPADAPPRPSNQLYFISKYLGQEICRVFAEYHGIETPTLVFSQFLNPSVTTGLVPFAVSWRDSARAIRCALEATLPAAYEVFSITSDLPHGRYSNRSAREILGWQPLDDLAHLWEE